ncbi:hypothetical protein MKW94_013471 [Papaver nudicaule]|uniref:E3 UFM1-protein ligase 1 homolog n=1 Tax=Papaver nudicaule TaxID=74823 RepID=A0AA41V308_PAPNU|nr:hypothetical protein [Papaver nudicaule]
MMEIIQLSYCLLDCLDYLRCVASFNFVLLLDIFDRMEKETETFILSKAANQQLHVVNEAKGRHESNTYDQSNEVGDESSGVKPGSEKGSKKKRGKTGNTKAAASESVPDISENLPTKSNKKNQRKNKEANVSQVSDKKSGGKSNKVKEDDLNIPDEDWIMEKILTLIPDFEGQGLDDPHTLIRPLATYLRPMLLNSWKERRKTVFTENAEKMKHLLDDLQKKLDEEFLNMQLYEKALDLFEDDPSVSVVLHKHLLRTTATSIVDQLLITLDMHNKLKNGIAVEESQKLESAALSSGDRVSLAKSLDSALSTKALSVVEALEGKRVETFMVALRALVEESGLLLKNIDKKMERTLLHSYRKDLTIQVSNETDPISLLPKVVSLLYLQVHNKALQAPGRAISAAVSRLKEKLEESAHQILLDYHSATVTLLALQSAAPDDEESCASDRIMTKKEFLESLMPKLKGLVLKNTESSSLAEK